jgi:hypothetical protein
MNIIGEFAPSNPKPGDLWFNIEENVLYRWVETSQMWVATDLRIPTVMTKEQFEEWAEGVITQ